MDTEKLSEAIARRVVEILRESGYLDAIRRKDGLTDIVQNLPSMTQGGGGQTEPNQSAGIVTASDGTVVTLGQKKGGQTSLSSPPEPT